MRQPRTVAAVILSLVISVGLLGIGYGAWNDTLAVDVTASSGTLEMVWLGDALDILCSDNDGNPGLASVEGSVDGGDARIAYFEIDNGYPGYIATCTYENRNVGTLPVMVTSMDINGQGVPSGIDQYFNLHGDPQYDLKIRFSHGPGATFDAAPNPEGGVAKLRIEILSGAPMGQDIDFEAHINIAQNTGP